MERAKLAQWLREKQYEVGYLDRQAIDKATDDQIIGVYVTCPYCGEHRLLSSREERETIAKAKNAEDWWGKVQAILCEHMSTCPDATPLDIFMEGAALQEPPSNIEEALTALITDVGDMPQWLLEISDREPISLSRKEIQQVCEFLKDWLGERDA